jgi:hypothetical protein
MTAAYPRVAVLADTKTDQWFNGTVIRFPELARRQPFIVEPSVDEKVRALHHEDIEWLRVWGGWPGARVHVSGCISYGCDIADNCSCDWGLYQ